MTVWISVKGQSHKKVGSDQKLKRDGPCKYFLKFKKIYLLFFFAFMPSVLNTILFWPERLGYKTP